MRTTLTINVGSRKAYHCIAISAPVKTKNFVARLNSIVGRYAKDRKPADQFTTREGKKVVIYYVHESYSWQGILRTIKRDF